MAEAVKTKKKGRLAEFCKNVLTEMKKVVWPTKKETVRYTAIVVVCCAFFALLFWLLDTGFLAILEKVLNITM